MITEEEKLDMGTAYYEDGFIDGVEKGKAEGEAKARRETAAALLKMGLDAQSVAEATQLSLGEVTVLREKS